MIRRRGSNGNNRLGDGAMRYTWPRFPEVKVEIVGQEKERNLRGCRVEKEMKIGFTKVQDRFQTAKAFV